MVDRDDRASGDCSAEQPRRLDAVEHGHLDVHHDGVEIQGLGEFDRFAPVGRAADDLEAPVRRQ